jgi:hypothetical protein
MSRGDGTLADPITACPTIRSPLWLATTDADGDGNLDLVVAAYGTLGPWLALGRGDGTFQSPVLLDSATNVSLATGDLNDDQRPDLVVVDSSSAKISVYLNKCLPMLSPLSVRRTGDTMVLNWPTTSGVRLEATEMIRPGADWLPLNEAPVHM